jgi:hypothetical protein
MTRLENRLSAAEIQALLAEMIADAGAWRVLTAAAKQALRRKTRPANGLITLNNHMRRDIGMAPYHPPPSATQLRW